MTCWNCNMFIRLLVYIYYWLGIKVLIIYKMKEEINNSFHRDFYRYLYSLATQLAFCNSPETEISQRHIKDWWGVSIDCILSSFPNNDFQSPWESLRMRGIILLRDTSQYFPILSLIGPGKGSSKHFKLCRSASKCCWICLNATWTRTQYCI